MKSIEYNKLQNIALPMNIVRLLTAINEYKGKQDLYKQQSPQILNTLKEVSVIQSTESSNRIEGIYTSNKRLSEIMSNKVEPRDRSESEIAGYRDVLNTIHSAYDAIPINSSVILQLHRDLYKFSPGTGGSYKNSNNIIEEILQDGSKFIRFKPVDMFYTSEYMEQLCNLYNYEVSKESVEPLVLIGLFVLDFLCIHPFNDGNGRMSRLITLLLLYRSGYDVGRFISIEKIIEDSKETYYESLNKSSMLWHEGEHNINIWLEYFLGSILRSYKELEDRVGLVINTKGSKSERVEKSIEGVLGYFTKEQIRNLCPDVAQATVNRVFDKLKNDKKIEVVGSGRNAKWKKI
ncbi:Fic family protein [Romboutsia sedimentorum]|uniref:Fic family protein n=1 Tax=Romboutsia sedimentorum TaxID=1368474 RepID=A0ABT7EA59_9FIRM|nr:Fic family protein [Romboutsia sedimentorum]MDK2562958.1 Fic family protein [Romboutsia sedimentorum]MDK2586322.1 Fic family protein [Romboutsia sedimentorum]